MRVSYLQCKRAAFFCLALPSAIFAIGFLRWYVGFPIACLLTVAYVFSLRDMRYEEERTVFLSVPTLIFILVTVAFWCYLSGLGNLYAQSEDWAARNAIFRDLIRMDWPVVYASKKAALVYYIGYWLPAALLGKGTLALTGRLSVAWTVGNLALLAWSVVCVFLTLLLVLVYLQTASKRQTWLVVLLFVFFSGPDIIGTVYNTLVRGWAFPLHLEWWSVYQFSSMTTALHWVFNQSVFAWMATVLFLFERRVRNYALIIACLLSASPLPAVGLGGYMVGYAFVLLWRARRERETGRFWRDVFTVQNLIAVFTLLPLYFLYYKTNLAVNVGQIYTVTPPRDIRGIFFLLSCAAVLTLLAVLLYRHGAKSFMRVWGTVITTLLLVVGVMIFDPTTRISYFLFLTLEVFVFLLLIWGDGKSNPIFWLTWGIAMLCPLITVGTAADFCMRASIPVVFILMILCLRYLLSHTSLLRERAWSWEKGAYVVLLGVIVLGAVTPTVEFYRGALEFAKGYRAYDWIYTFDRIFEGPLASLDRNFIANGYEETLFYRFLAK